MPRDQSPSGKELRRSGRLARNRIRIAWMYYVEGLTQNEIADKLGIGRVTVVRNINEAIRQREVKIDYLGFPIPDEFVVGYGLDFAERYRNLPFIAVLKNPEA